jgi:hypothetical protein
MDNGIKKKKRDQTCTLPYPDGYICRIQTPICSLLPIASTYAGSHGPPEEEESEGRSRGHGHGHGHGAGRRRARYIGARRGRRPRRSLPLRRHVQFLAISRGRPLFPPPSLAGGRTPSFILPRPLWSAIFQSKSRPNRWPTGFRSSTMVAPRPTLPLPWLLWPLHRRLIEQGRAACLAPRPLARAPRGLPTTPRTTGRRTFSRV